MIKSVSSRESYSFGRSLVYRHDLDSFPALKDILEEVDGSTELLEVLYDEIVEHLKVVTDGLSQCFPGEGEEKLQDYLCAKNTFSCTEKSL